MNENQNINIDISQTEEVICDECKNNTFQQAFQLRKVSAIIAGQEGLLPVLVYECTKCGHINEMFKPN